MLHQLLIFPYSLMDTLRPISLVSLVGQLYRMLCYRHMAMTKSLIKGIPTFSGQYIDTCRGYDEHGRGMLLVETLAFRWGWKTAPDWPGWKFTSIGS